MITITSICVAIILFFVGQSSSAFLIVFGIVTKLLSSFALTLISLPGRFIAFPDNAHKQSKAKMIGGIIVSICIQSFIYLAYTAFIVGWARSSALGEANQFIVWPIAFLAATVPIAFSLKEFRKSVKETEHATKDMSKKLKQAIGGPEIKMFKMLYQATLITFLLTLAMFLIFVISPTIMESIYSWIPYVAL